MIWVCVAAYFAGAITGQLIKLYFRAFFYFEYCFWHRMRAMSPPSRLSYLTDVLNGTLPY